MKPRPESPAGPSSAVQRRIFLVGCPRSGAELLQRHLAGCAGVHAFRETGLFRRSSALRNGFGRFPWSQAMRGGAIEPLHRIVEAARPVASAHSPVPEDPPARKLSVAGAVGVLDRIALAQGRRVWLERMPRDFRHALAIERLVPQACVIHVIRDGRDVVASMCDRVRRHPRYFGRHRGAGSAIRQWNRAIDMHARCVERSGHVFVLYEDLAAHPERELARVLRACGLAAAPPEVAAARAAGTPTATRPREKFRNLFDAEGRRGIEGRLDLERYGRLAEALSRARQGVQPDPGRGAA